jgi:hypothetical protein
LNDLLEQMAQHSDDVIEIVTNTTVSMTVIGRLNIGGLFSVAANNSTFLEITVDLGAATDLSVTVTGERNLIQRDGNLHYDTLTTLANQVSEFEVESNYSHIAVPDTTTRLLIKHSTGVDVEYTFDELKKKFKSSEGLTYVDNGAVKFATKWYVIPFLPRELQGQNGGYTQGVKITTSNSASFYILKKY